jgi:metal-responsive CopG/Arc/MetJ family transcriptional regulator
MKQKTSITLSEDVIEELNRAAGDTASRSAYIERVLRQHFRRQFRRAREKRDLERINRAADRLNRETVDVLEYQAGWPEE